MLTIDNRNKLAELNLPLDRFGQPLKVGDTVLTKAYGSAVLDYLATIKRINAKSVSVTVEQRRWDHGEIAPRPDGHTGVWNYYPNRTIVTELVPMRRSFLVTILIPPTFKDILNQAAANCINTYPEVFI